MMLDKNEFVNLCMKYQQDKKIKKAKIREAAIIDYSMNNRFRVERRLRGCR